MLGQLLSRLFRDDVCDLGSAKIMEKKKATIRTILGLQGVILGSAYRAWTRVQSWMTGLRVRRSVYGLGLWSGLARACFERGLGFRV